MEIFEKLSLIFLPILLTAFFISIIPRKLKERQRFIEATVEFRKIFNQALVDTQSGRHDFGTPVSDDIIKLHRVAYLNFLPHFRGGYRNQYNEAWDQYYHDFENMGHAGMFTHVTRADLQKDIKSLLEFTEYRRFRNIFFFWKRLWSRLRFKIFGPDKETKKIVEKFSKAYQNKNHLS
jgi:hypothetical protein